MKSSYIIFIALAIVIIGFIFVAMGGNEAEAPTVGTEQKASETTPTTNDMPMTNDHGMTDEEHAAMMGEASAGSDVGMEMPETDMSGMNMGGTGVSTDPDAKIFMIHGANFSYDIKEIRVKEGDTVTINFMSTDGFHDWVLDEFNAKSEKIRTGGMTSVTFVADKKGTFEYYCSVGSHRASGMVGKLIVE